MSFDPDAVRAFEYAGWKKAASAYRDGWYLIPMAAIPGRGVVRERDPVMEQERIAKARRAKNNRR